MEQCKEQKGAFKSLENAKRCADKYKLKVFAGSGNEIYPKSRSSSQKSVNELAMEQTEKAD